MGARLVVVAVFALAAAATGDALRETGGGEQGRGSRTEAGALPVLVAGRGHEYVVEGAGLFKNRVTRSGTELLGAEAIAHAFPGQSENPIDVSKVATAPDGTIVLGVYRFRPGLPAEGAVELWRGTRLESAFLVPTGWFGGGFAFSRDGAFIATVSHDGGVNGVFDRRGRLVSGLGDSLSR
jgi:hypothetical protein